MIIGYNYNYKYYTTTPHRAVTTYKCHCESATHVLYGVSCNTQCLGLHMDTSRFACRQETETVQRDEVWYFICQREQGTSVYLK